MTHEELRTNIDAWALGALPEAEARQVEAHLAECPECQAEARTAGAVAVGLAGSVADSAPSPAVRARLMSAVAAGREARVEPLPFVVRERPSLAARTGWLVAAASLVLAAYLTWDGLRLRDQVATLSAQLAEAKALVAAADTRIATLQNAAERGTSAMAVLTAPDLARIDLVGQPDAPDARARAFWSRERGMVFSASKLAATAAGQDLPGVGRHDRPGPHQRRPHRARSPGSRRRRLCHAPRHPAAEGRRRDAGAGRRRPRPHWREVSRRLGVSGLPTLSEFAFQAEGLGTQSA